MFFAIDGIDGAGKTTLVNYLREIFKEFNPLLTKEPTNISEWGIKLREAAKEGRLTDKEELEYFKKDRQFHLTNRIEPALIEGRLVITDRYADSTLAFQAKTPFEADELYKTFVNEIRVPDITFILSCPVEIGLGRVRARDGENLSEFETEETLTIASRIYESRSGDNYVKLKATGTAEETLEQALKAIVQRIPKLSGIAQKYLEENYN
jgi:dTMP kinase